MTVIQKHYLVIFPVLLFALLALCGVARAETGKVTIGRKEFSKPEVIRSFLYASISPGFGFEIGENYTPLYNQSHPDSNKLFAPETFREAYPWLYPLLYPDGLPHALVINKWTQPVRISMSFPNDLKPYGDAGKEPVMARLATWDKEERINKQAEQIVRDEAAKAAPELAVLTGLPVTWVPDEPKGDPKAVSNLRIVMVHDISLWTTPFSYGVNRSTRSGSGERLRNSPDIYHFDTVERRLSTLVAFTPMYAYGVNGYFVPDQDNEIQFALCYIWDGHDEPVLRKLVQECLVRGLGLPGAASLNYKEQAVLSSWHGPFPLDYDRLTKEEKEIVYSVVAIPESLKDKFVFPPVVPGRTESDDYFVRLLYSDFIKPGMTYLDVYKTLTQTLGTPNERQ